MRVTVKEIAQRLASRADSVARYLLPLGKQNGKLWECGGVDGHPGKSLKVNIDGQHPGKWIDWANDEEKGDLLDLWKTVRNISAPEALKQAKEYLGIREEILQTKTYSAASAAHPVVVEGQNAMQWLVTNRKLEPSVVNRFRVSFDAEKSAIAFPSFDLQGVLVNHSYRTHEKRVWQDKGCAPCLFGWHALADRAWEKREILICEGQIDALTWTQWGFDALSLPNGSGLTWIDYEWQNLEAFQTFYLAFDQDEAGKEITAKTISRLGKHRCRIIRYPYKDANDALKAGVTSIEASKWIEESEFEAMPHLESADHFADEVAEIFYPTKKNASGIPLEITTHREERKTFRFRDGELFVWTGTMSHGKSTLINLSAVYLATLAGAPALIFSMEQCPAQVLHRQISALFKIGNPDDARSAATTLKRHIIFYNKLGHIEIDALFETMIYAHARYGVKDIVIDSMMRVGALEEDYPAQTKFIVRLVTVARETGCRIHLVAHPRKSTGENPPRAYDIAGGGNIGNNADNVLVMWRNMEKERKADSDKKEDREAASKMPDAVLFVEKDRIGGDLKKFPLTYLYEKFSYTTFIPIEEPFNK